jgi:hypothetical protein
MLHARYVAVSAAVICFFGLGIVGSIGGLSPDVCCQRALLGAIVAYVAAHAAVRAVTAILTHAMITSQIQRDKEQVGDDKDQANR